MKKLPCKQRNGPQNGVINIQAVGYNGMSTAIVLYFTTIIAQLLSITILSVYINVFFCLIVHKYCRIY